MEIKARAPVLVLTRFLGVHRCRPPNAVFRIEGGAGLGLTYVTGARVAGSACGALTYHWINRAAIWFAEGMALSLSAVVAAARRS
jgi:uncharacterized membrane protein YoaK (UPF0700 family)